MTIIKCQLVPTGDLEQTELGFDAAAALRKAVHSTLARCSLRFLSARQLWSHFATKSEQQNEPIRGSACC